MSTLVKLGSYCALWSVLAVGGNTVALSDIHRATVEVERWLTDAQFVALFALAQAAPGPNGMALVLIGLQAAGLPGAFTALVAKLAPSSLIAFHGGAWFDRRRGVPWVAAVRRGLAPVTVGLILAASFVLARAADTNALRAALTAVGAAAVFRAGLNPLWLIGAAAALGGMSGVGGWELF